MEHVLAVAAKTKVKNHSKILKFLQFQKF